MVSSPAGRVDRADRGERALRATRIGCTGADICWDCCCAILRPETMGDGRPDVLLMDGIENPARTGDLASALPPLNAFEAVSTAIALAWMSLCDCPRVADRGEGQSMYPTDPATAAGFVVAWKEWERRCCRSRACCGRSGAGGLARREVVLRMGRMGYTRQHSSTCLRDILSTYCL